MVLFVGAHRPDRKPVFRVFRVFGFPGFRFSGFSGVPGVRRVGFAGQPGIRSPGLRLSRFRFRFLFRFRPRLRGRSCSSGPLRPPMHLARLRALSVIRLRGASDASLRASAAHLLFRMPSGDRLPIPPRSVACFSPSRRRQRLSPLPEIRWRCMRERSLSTFICATSSSS